MAETRERACGDRTKPRRYTPVLLSRATRSTARSKAMAVAAAADTRARHQLWAWQHVKGTPRTLAPNLVRMPSSGQLTAVLASAAQHTAPRAHSWPAHEHTHQPCFAPHTLPLPLFPRSKLVAACFTQHAACQQRPGCHSGSWKITAQHRQAAGSPRAAAAPGIKTIAALGAKLDHHPSNERDSHAQR